MATQRQGTDFGILLGLAYQAFVVELREDLERAGLGGMGRAEGRGEPRIRAHYL